MTTRCDLLIVGGGPAGLAAAINAASEGLETCVIDSRAVLGGQARESSAIENYPGFPRISGARLARRFICQAERFGARLITGKRAAKLESDGRDRVVICADGAPYVAKVVLLANGVAYRKHDAAGVDRLTGRGVFYGTPTQPRANGQFVIVGGANSAGQAAESIAANPESTVHIVTRSPIEKAMSHYLVERLRARPNVKVWEGATVDACNGEQALESCKIVTPQGKTVLQASSLFVLIGARPSTDWLNVERDAHGFIVAPRFETSTPRVYACGDVRAGSIKRIASAIGGGANALQAIHSHF